jgi:hypothetical protein
VRTVTTEVTDRLLIVVSGICVRCWIRTCLITTGAVLIEGVTSCRHGLIFPSQTSVRSVSLAVRYSEV